jgi:hypothetical protein
VGPSVLPGERSTTELVTSHNSAHIKELERSEFQVLLPRATDPGIEPFIANDPLKGSALLWPPRHSACRIVGEEI